MHAELLEPPLREVAFDNPVLDALGIELMTLRQLRQRLHAGDTAYPERVDFLMLLLVSAGSGRHTVDFVDYPVAPGAVICVRPGQVQQWHLDNDVDGQLLLISPVALPQSGAAQGFQERDMLRLAQWPTHAWIASEAGAQITSSAERLGGDFADFDGSARDIQLIRHGLMILLLRLAKWHAATGAISDAAAVTHGAYRMFVQALEQSFAVEHSLQFYATRLGYAASTLSRACMRMEGRSAKQVIDRRVALEAQRLLAHGDAAVASIGNRLGFSEATNFIKFFRRMTGLTPAAFRQRYLAMRGA